MKLLVLSDTHGKTEISRQIIKRLSKKISAVFHLGDMVDDAKELEREFQIPFHYVAGNCDFYYSSDAHLVDEKIVSYNGVKILLTHGHKHKIKYDYLRLALAAEEKEARVALCGHTHVPFLETVNGVLIVNPGSITYPRDLGGKPSYAVLDISDDGYVSASIVRLK